MVHNAKLAFFTLVTVTAVSLLGFATLGFAQAEQSPKVVALKFHADWCGYCKAMGPVFEDLEAKFDGQPILFINLDRTTVTTRNKAQLLASALGFEKIYHENSGTGFILLVDKKSGNVISKLTSTKTSKEMATEIDKALTAG